MSADGLTQPQLERELVRVAIVGRPNVGKSSIFNRLAGRRIAIVHDQPGVTRDRISAHVERGKRSYEFFDTGGIGLPEEGAPEPIARAVRSQAELGIEVADLVIFVVDGQEGIVPLDQEIAQELRKQSKPVLVAVNKIDHEKHAALEAEFSALGLPDRLALSAEHDRGFDALWRRLERVPGRPMQAGEIRTTGETTKLAVVGRPNVGKSTLINRLLGAERVIVSEMAGTTRDAVDVPIEAHGRRFVLIDTAGIRHQRRIRSSVEVFSKMRSENSVSRCDIAVLVVDAEEGFTRQDKVIAGFIQENEKPCCIVVNKWDLNEVREGPGKKLRRVTSRSEYETNLRREVPFLAYAPVLFTSALEGYRAENLWKLILKIDKARRQQFSTGSLNRIFTKAQKRMPSPARGGKRFKIFYAVQDPDRPVPTFLVFVNDRKLFDESYGRFLRNSLREEMEYTGCPIVFRLRDRQPKAKTASGGRGAAPKRGPRVDSDEF